MEEYYLELSTNPVRFEAVNQLTNVFFDDSNREVFAVRSEGVMGVVVKSSDESQEPLNFRMEDHGPVVSIKFSLDHKILAVQRTNNSVEFMNFNGQQLDVEYSQSCKRGCNIRGFVWSNINEVAFITDKGVELYMVIPDKKSLKNLKSTAITVQWFVWCSLNKIALLASQQGSHLLPVQFKQGSFTKLPKVETEPGRMALERDVTLATLYNVPAVLILRHQASHFAEVHVHTMSGSGQAPIKSHVLKLGLSGRFAINVVDDLILVHHQASRSSQIFDIALPRESDGNVRYHSSIVPPKAFKPAVLSLPALVEPQTHLCELYSPNWVVFQPNIVIDAKLGCLWHINLCLKELCDAISDLSICTQVALKRTNGKDILLSLLLQVIRQPIPPLDKIQEAFNHINKVYFQENTPTCNQTTTTVLKQKINRIIIDQDDIYREIFQKLDMENDLKTLEWVLVAYITSLTGFKLQAQHNINDLIVTTLARREKFSTLQQMLQYGVIWDSKPIACLLLSLGNKHRAAPQIAMDMLSRINAKEEMQVVLLSEGQILSALKVTDDKSFSTVRKFLSAAQQCENHILFHSILFHFQNSPGFAASFTNNDRLLTFIQEYTRIFNIE